MCHTSTSPMRDKLYDYLRQHPSGAAPEELLDLVFTQPRRDAEFGPRFLQSLLATDPRFRWREGEQRWSITLHDALARDISDTDFVVVDLETAGTTPHAGAIIEIAALRIRGGKAVNTFQSLVRPAIKVPAFIAHLTGIDEAMLSAAPPITQVWRQFREFVADDVLLAHNAPFDLSFLQAAAQAIEDATFNNTAICTLKLARRLVPESTKRGLDALAGLFGIPIVDRHRAHGDVRITAEIFFHLCERLHSRNIVRLDQLVDLQNQARDGRPFDCPLPRFKVDQLPAEPGIYRFFDATGRLLYIGKAKSLRQRVASYLSNSGDHSGKTLDLIRHVHDLRVETTGSELEAALEEAAAIRREQPPYNRLGKHLPRIAFLKLTSRDPFPRLMITRRLAVGGATHIGPLRSRDEGERLLGLITRLFQLRTCAGRLHPDAAFVPCFQAQIDACSAPCAARVDTVQYAQQVQACLSAIAGDLTAMRDELERRRDRASVSEHFELAARIQRDIEFVERMARRQRTVGWITAQQCFLVLHGLNDRRVVAAYGVIAGRLALRRRLVDTSEVDAFAADLSQCFADRRALSAADVDGTVILAAWLRDRGERTGSVLPIEAPGESGWKAEMLSEWRAALAEMLSPL